MDTLTLSYDQGANDSYYRRPRNPHYWTEGSLCKPGNTKVTLLSTEERNEYLRGYEANENNGNHKDYSNITMSKEVNL